MCRKLSLKNQGGRTLLDIASYRKPTVRTVGGRTKKGPERRRSGPNA
jgi:hypothetical protein